MLAFNWFLPYLKISQSGEDRRCSERKGPLYYVEWVGAVRLVRTSAPLFYCLRFGVNETLLCEVNRIRLLVCTRS
jgi:hypothetical protein